VALAGRLMSAAEPRNPAVEGQRGAVAASERLNQHHQTVCLPGVRSIFATVQAHLSPIQDVTVARCASSGRRPRRRSGEPATCLAGNSGVIQIRPQMRALVGLPPLATILGSRHPRELIRSTFILDPE
jgi:hypothetical protein